MPVGGRGGRRDPDDGRARRAGDRDRGRLRVRARGGAWGGPRGGGARAARVAADRGEPRLGARRDARRPVGRACARDSRRRGRALPARCPRMPPALLRPGTRALTHCNAGGLATGGYGSAVGALLAAWERDLLAHVWVDETRPLLQGARLTAWELETAGIPHTVIVDSAAATLMAAGRVDAVFTGADRIAANGDTANKIGTYGLAVQARHHGVPFRVVAPSSTVDLATATGDEIPIEERDAAEVTARFDARNPAFDVTPAELIDAIVTEHGCTPRRTPCRWPARSSAAERRLPTRRGGRRPRHAGRRRASASAAAPAAPRCARRRCHTFVTELAQTCDRSRPTVDGVARRSPLPAALRRLWQSWLVRSAAAPAAAARRASVAPRPRSADGAPPPAASRRRRPVRRCGSPSTLVAGCGPTGRAAGVALVRAPGGLLCDACRASLTLVLAPLCARCGAPTAWPVTRCVECSGRRLAFASARAAVAYAGVAATARARRGRSAASARLRPWPPSSSSTSFPLRRQTSSPISRPTAIAA